MAFFRFLRSPGLALGTLLFWVFLAGSAAWMPAGRFPPWLGGEHPFRSAPFLVACAVLFVNTLACTWDRTARTASVWYGKLPASALTLEAGEGREASAFLRARGFRGRGDLLFRFRHALWGGWLLHVGVLLLMAGIAIQQLFHEEGTFLLTEGAQVCLKDPGAVEGRVAGPLAPEVPPDLTVALLAFDPALHQTGYAPDRASRIGVSAGQGPLREVTLDRASGVTARGITLFHAIPTGLALVTESAPGTMRSIHLRGSDRVATAVIVDPHGRPVLFSVEGERALDDPRGTGALTVRVEQGGHSVKVSPGETFAFGEGRATLRAVARWGTFTYSRSPGMPGVFSGIVLVLAGCGLLTFPAGVAVVSEGVPCRVFLARGSEALSSAWRAELATRVERTG